MNVFLQLFNLSGKPTVKVGEIGSWRELSCVWNLNIPESSIQEGITNQSDALKVMIIEVETRRNKKNVLEDNTCNILKNVERVKLQKQGNTDLACNMLVYMAQVGQYFIQIRDM